MGKNVRMTLKFLTQHSVRNITEEINTLGLMRNYESMSGRKCNSYDTDKK